MGLASLRQDDFSAGMWRSLAPHRIPQNGCWDLTNLLIDNQGLPYERGGIEPYSGAFSSSDITNVWDALLEMGRRTLFSTPTEIGVLDADGVTPIKLMPPGFFVGIPAPRRGTVIGGRLYIDGGLVYAGSRTPGEYGGGTASATHGSTTIVGTGTSWLANIGPGFIFNTAGARNSVVASVTDDTHLELTSPWKEDSQSDFAYIARSIGAPHKLANIYGTAGRRLLALIDDKLYFSRNIDPVIPVDRTDDTFQGILAKPDEDPENFVDGDYHQMPHSPGGLGIASWGDTAIVFTTDGVWLVSNMDLEPVDAAGNVQQALTHSAPQVVLWHRNGIAPWQDAFIVPARDGVYVLGANTLEKVDTPINPLYRSYVRAGLTLGIATVFEGHYFLPVLDGLDHVDTLVCRLDRPVRTGAGTVRPWSHFDGLPIRAFAQQETSNSPNLLIASSGDKILRGRYFEPEATDSIDNGSTFTSQLVTRDIPTGRGNKNLVREVDVDYDLVDTVSGNNPTLIADFAIDHPAETASYTSGGANGPEDTDQFTKWLFAEPPRARYIRVRLRPSGRLKSLLIRSIQILVRQSNKNE